MELGLAHYVYLAGVVLIITTMAFRKNVVVPAVGFTVLVSWSYTGDLVDGIGSIFRASLTAAAELFNIFLIIALVTAMLGALKRLGSDHLMVLPFRRVMVNGTIAFWTLAAVTFFISLFFWPTPAVPLVGAILLPAAIRAGLPPLRAGMVIAISGQGMALGADYVIQVAPDISATAAGVQTSDVADRTLILSVVTGIVALVVAYARSRPSMRSPSPWMLTSWEQGLQWDQLEHENARPTRAPKGGFRTKVLAQASRAIGGSGDSSGDLDTIDDENAEPEGIGAVDGDEGPHETGTTGPGPDGAVAEQETTVAPNRRCRTFAVIVPVSFVAVLAYMLIAKFSDSVETLEGNDAAALVGGAAGILLLAASICDRGRKALEDVSEHVVDGYVFAFKAMGVVLPIAGFFFVGNPDFAGAIMGLDEDAESPALLFDLVEQAYDVVPEVGFITGLGVLLVGMVTGLDGSGFSGLPLTGSLSGAFGPEVGIDPATLAAIGQLGAIWVGGGTLVAWSSLVAVAGFARVPVLELVRKCFVPVLTGLFVATIVAIVFLG